MEILLFIIVLAILGWVNDFFENKSDTKNTDSQTTLNNELIVKDTLSKNNSYEKDTNTKIINIQNNTYIQQNNYNVESEELDDHTEKIWNKLGYQIQYGETYAYKMYGKEIFTPEQVVQKVTKSTTNYVKYSEKGLVKKLLNNTGSKKITKDILVEEYGYSQSKAKKLVGYREY